MKKISQKYDKNMGLHTIRNKTKLHVIFMIFIWGNGQNVKYEEKLPLRR